MLINETKRTAIVVLGMHRSGTSVLTKIISTMGYELPKTLLTASKSNETGHWESILLNRLNDKILLSIGSTWQSWREISIGFSDTPNFESLRHEAIELLDTEFGIVSSFAFKDPRLCRLMEFWKLILQEIDVDPIVICPIRNPLETALSLEQRNSIPQPVGLFIWLRYVLEAEISTRGMTRSFVHYADLLNNWQTTIEKISRETNIPFICKNEQDGRELSTFVSSKYRHHVISDNSVIFDNTIPEWVRTTYSIFVKWSKESESKSDFAELDRIRDALNTIPPSLHVILDVGQKYIDDSRKLKKRIEVETAQSSELAQKALQQQTERDVYVKQLEEVQSRFEEAIRESSKESATSFFNIKKFEETKGYLTELKGQLSETEQQYEKVLRDWAQRDAEATLNAEALREKQIRLSETEKRLQKTIEDLMKQEVVSSIMSEQFEETKGYLTELKGQLSETEQQYEKVLRDWAQRDAEATLNAEALREKQIRLSEVEELLYDTVDRFNGREAELKSAQDGLYGAEIRLAETEEKLNDFLITISEYDEKFKETKGYLTELKGQLSETEQQYEKVLRDLVQKDAEATLNAEALREKQIRLSETEQNLNKSLGIIGKYDEEFLAKTDEIQTLKDKLYDGRSKLQKTLNARDIARKNLLKREETLSHKEREITALKLKLFANREKLQKTLNEKEVNRREVLNLESTLKKINDTFVWKAHTYLEKIIRNLCHSSSFNIGNSKVNEVEWVSKSNYFDAKWYSEQYPDVVDGGLNPAKHYFSFGAKEGRDPSSRFSTQFYLNRYPDVAHSNINPLVHFERFGINEDREIAPSKYASKKKPITNHVPSAQTSQNKAHSDNIQDEGTDVYKPSGQSAVFSTSKISYIKYVDMPNHQEGEFIRFCNEIIGLSHSQKGIALKNSGIIENASLFCKMMGLNDESIFVGKENIDFLSAYQVYLDDINAMLSLKFSLENWKIGSVWYVNGQDIRIRFSAEENSKVQPIVVRFFQHDRAGIDKLVLVGEKLLINSEIEIADIALINPFFPIFVTYSTLESYLLCTSLIPFPSLCRGGQHFAELTQMQSIVNTPENLQFVSQKLLLEYIHSIEESSYRALGRIEIDINKALGSEVIFSNNFKEWLWIVMRLKLSIWQKSSGESKDNVSCWNEAINVSLLYTVPDREMTENFGLVCPANALPSLHVLVAGADNIGTFCSTNGYIAKDLVLEARRWYVNIPAISQKFLWMKPENFPIAFPFLYIIKLLDFPLNEQKSHFGLPPIAIVQRDISTVHQSALIMPVAPEIPLILKNDNIVSEISKVVIIYRNFECSQEELSAFFESLLLQEGIYLEKFIFIHDHNQANFNEIAKGLEHYFHDKYILIESGNDLEEKTIKALFPEEHFVFVVQKNIVVHDPRTLMTLTQIANEGQVGSVGCLSVYEKNDGKKSFLQIDNGGLVPEHNIFPYSTYPVASNDCTVMVARTNIWTKYGGSKIFIKGFEDEDDNFMINTLNSGFIHLFTTVVSIESKQSYVSKELNSKISLEILCASSTLMQELN